MQIIDSSNLVIAFAVFVIAFIVLFIGNATSKRARNLPLIFPSQNDFTKACSNREDTLLYLTRLWRVITLIEILLFSLGGYLILGVPGAIILGIIISLDYIRNNSPLSGIDKDPLIRIELALEHTLLRTNNVDELLAIQLENISKNREMSDSEFFKLLTYLSNRSDKIGDIARDIALKYMK